MVHHHLNFVSKPGHTDQEATPMTCTYCRHNHLPATHTDHNGRPAHPECVTYHASLRRRNERLAALRAERLHHELVAHITNGGPRVRIDQEL